MDIKELKGKTFFKIEVSEDKEAIIFHQYNGPNVKMYHEQDCCESVSIEDIIGDLEDLIGNELLMAEEVSSEQFTKEWEENGEAEGHDSYTWTFYKLATIKGYVDIRWFGSSNGYYSEGVSVREAKEDGSYDWW